MHLAQCRASAVARPIGDDAQRLRCCRSTRQVGTGGALCRAAANGHTPPFLRGELGLIIADAAESSGALGGRACTSKRAGACADVHGERRRGKRMAPLAARRAQLAGPALAQPTPPARPHLARQAAAAMPKRAAVAAPAKEAAAAEGDGPSTSGSELSRVVYLGCVSAARGPPAP